MQSNLQQQRQSIKKEEQANPAIQTVTQNDGQKTSTCPNCHAKLPEEALFCPECGLSIKQRVCPKCGAPASPTADICQVCGAWLLEGKCKFCYADLSSSDALFCPECGKPKDGISCPHCGKLSIFDFCSNCGKPVTEEAIAELKHAQEEIVSEASSAVSETTTPETAKKTFKSKLETLINSEPEPETIEDEAPPVPVRKSLFSERQMESIRKTGAAVDEITRQRAEEAERQRLKKEAQERKEALERQLRARGWRCNAYGVVHHGGPNECGDPSMGGQWL